MEFKHQVSLWTDTATGVPFKEKQTFPDFVDLKNKPFESTP